MPLDSVLLQDVPSHVSPKPGSAQRGGSPFSVRNEPTPMPDFVPGEAPEEGRRGGCCHPEFLMGFEEAPRGPLVSLRGGYEDPGLVKYVV